MLRKILLLLTPHEKRRGALVLTMVTVMAVLEVAGIASVMPFLSVLGNPGVIESNAWFAFVYNGLGFQTLNAFLVALGAAAFSLILFSALFRGVTHYAMNRFIEMRRHSLSERLLDTYLRQPYAFFLDRHSSDMAKGILSEVNQVTGNVFRPAMEAVAYGVVLLGIVLLLLVINPLIAIVVVAVLGGLYGGIYAIVRGVLGRIGQDRVQANQERFTAAGEALGGIKDIKLLGREHAYLSRFHGPSIRFSRHQATAQTLGQVPNFLVEAVAFGGIILLIVVLLVTQGGAAATGFGGILPTIGLFAFAGLRMKPAAQKVYMGISQLRFGAAALASVEKDLNQSIAGAEVAFRAPSPWRPQSMLALCEMHYAYPNARAEALSGIDIEIPVGSSLGLVGTTGAGKTTLVDVLLGLLRPTRGGITIDGEPVTDADLRAYQQALGYVPQDIFLTDSSVSENIALGIPRQQVDQQQVERCARMAQVHEFIMNELAQQYDTVVGERGVRLSGGQRQRIGIARALYHDPSVVVFDEATSALDSTTEAAVMEAIAALHHEKTIILIAHRLSTVRACDKVVLLEKGQVVAGGTFEELQRHSEQFREMAART